jgi:hypothetical protein
MADGTQVEKAAVAGAEMLSSERFGELLFKTVWSAAFGRTRPEVRPEHTYQADDFAQKAMMAMMVVVTSAQQAGEGSASGDLPGLIACGIGGGVTSPEWDEVVRPQVVRWAKTTAERDLLDRLAKRGAAKRGGGEKGAAAKVELARSAERRSAGSGAGDGEAAERAAEALEDLAVFDEGRWARVLEQRLAGRTLADTAGVLGLSVSQVRTAEGHAQRWVRWVMRATAAQSLPADLERLPAGRLREVAQIRFAEGWSRFVAAGVLKMTEAEVVEAERDLVVGDLGEAV